MTVITVSRQTGSLGSQISKLAAEKLGYQIIWQELINQAARRAGVPEVALASIDELGLLGISPSPQACLAYRQAVKQVMEELAAHNNIIIIGRAGQTVLASWPNALHVRIIAPFETRAERIAQRQGITIECARAQIKASDQHRASYLLRCYHIRWENPELYHIVINTGLMSIPLAVTIICQAAVNSSVGDPALETL